MIISITYKTHLQAHSGKTLLNSLKTLWNTLPPTLWNVFLYRKLLD